jgi:hypothetical protein
MASKNSITAQWKKVEKLFYYTSAAFFLFSIPTTLGWVPISHILQPMLEVHYFIASYMAVAYLVTFLVLLVLWAVMSLIAKDQLP